MGPNTQGLCKLVLVGAKPIYPTIAVHSTGKGRRPSIPPTSLTFASLLLIPSKEKLIDYHIPALVAECQSERRMAEVGVMRFDDWPSPRLHL